MVQGAKAELAAKSGGQPAREKYAMKIRNLLRFALFCAPGFAMTACDFRGGVVQGRCVAFDPDTRMLTMVVDTTLDQ